VPRSNYAITGLYFCDNQVLDISASLKPSQRGELEITDVSKAYMHQRKLQVEVTGRSFAWLDTGTRVSLLQASQYVEILEQRQGLRIACPDDANRHGYISLNQLHELAQRTSKSG
jgi:glucose-1-phosphate thymidylyltransferase